MTDSKKLTIYTKLNVYYCNGILKPKIVANSIYDLFNNKNARDYLPTNKAEFKNLKTDIYYWFKIHDFIDVAYFLIVDYNLFINTNNMIEYLTKICGFTTEQAKKHFTNYITDTDNNKRVLEYFNN